jgi:hypothetical protein
MLISTPPLVRSFTSWANLVAARCCVESTATSWASLSLYSALKAMLASGAMEPIVHPITNPISFISFIANLPLVAPVRPRTTGDFTFGYSKSGRHDESEPLGRSAEPLHGMLG